MFCNSNGIMANADDAKLDPCVEAAKAGDCEKLRELAAADATGTAKAADPTSGKPALLFAAERGHAEALSALLDAGADMSAALGGWNAACYAAFGGHTEVLSVLTKRFGEKAARAPEGAGLTPLLLAALKGHAPCAELLLGADRSALDAVDEAGRTPLMLAASAGAAGLIDALAERGVAIDARDARGMTALMWAVASNRPASVGALAKLGADPTLRAEPDPNAPPVPGRPKDLGVDAEEIAAGKHGKDPTLRHIAAYLKAWKAARATNPTEPAPPMPPLPWVEHAHETVRRLAEEARNPPAAPPAADEPVSTGDGNDIFDVSDAAPADGDAPPPPATAPAEATADFQPSARFEGARAGFVYKSGERGAGYYRDTAGASAGGKGSAAEAEAAKGGSALDDLD